MNRLRLIWYENRHPGYPWLTPDANGFLESYLRPDDVGLEFGSGRSTLWFAGRVAKVTSVEHNESWYKRVSCLLDRHKLRNVDYLLRPDETGEEHAAESGYVKVVELFSDDSLDFCLVDGIFREYCVLGVLQKLRRGGLLIFDNVNWYLPHDTLTPYSRQIADGQKNDLCRKIVDALSSWRRYWTSSGVTDTAIFFKPS